MSNTCLKTQQDKIGALYILGQLIIFAEGQKPTPCHKVRIEHWPFRIYPPQYQIVACIDEGVICPQMVVLYKASSFFSVSRETLDAMGGYAVVHHRDGVEKVQVNVIELPEKRTKLLAVKEAGGGGGMPSPFSASGGDVPFPFSLSELFETGRGEDIKFLNRNDVSLHTATGYSNSFSFTEAFQNAIENLPPDPDPFPDKLTNVTVVRVGGNFGGFAGLSRMYVTVVSFY
jgi:hypothetical protein